MKMDSRYRCPITDKSYCALGGNPRRCGLCGNENISTAQKVLVILICTGLISLIFFL